MTIKQLFAEADVTAQRLEGDAEVSTMTMDSRGGEAGAGLGLIAEKKTQNKKNNL